MKSKRLSMVLVPLCFLSGIYFVLNSANTAQADPVPRKYRKHIRKALDWLAKNQARDGHWAGNGDQYRVSMTALAGMALLCDGSTIHSGRYAKNIRRATDWLMKQCQRGGRSDGLITSFEAVTRTRYMYGHGFALMFLACVYGDENDKSRREKLKDILTRAVKYTVNAQASNGGYYYTSNADGGNRDEGSVTVTQVQALRAAKNAGIPVPVASIRKTQKYLKACTGPNGGVGYSFRSKNERPAVTAAAVCCGFSSGDYTKDKYVKKWLKYCQRMIPLTGAARYGHKEYTHYYFSQCIYVLGDDGWEKLYGSAGKSNAITWSDYRKQLFEALIREQQSDGGWPSRGGFGSPGRVYATALYATIMQLDKNTLPIYQR